MIKMFSLSHKWLQEFQHKLMIKACFMLNLQVILMIIYQLLLCHVLKEVAT